MNNLSFFIRFLRDKTMVNKFICIPNDNKQDYKIQFDLKFGSY